MYDTWEKYKDRTKAFAIRVIQLYKSLPNDKVYNIIGGQLLRSATSVASNYRAACRGRSTAERYSKLCIVTEEADETLFWLELIAEINIFKKEKLTDIINEAEAILKIMNTAKYNASPPKKMY
jgi:four helix bundle protein